MDIIHTYWEAGKEYIRLLLGPSSNTSYFVFENDEVLPENRQHPSYAPTAQYNQKEKQIQSVVTPDQHYKRLPWLSVQHKMGEHVIDLSDWISEIRTNTTISLLSFLRLAANVHGYHLPETKDAVVKVINRMGTEEEFRYVEKTRLLPIMPEMHRKQTCPYDIDSSEGMPLF